MLRVPEPVIRVRQQGVEWREIDGEVVILDGEKSVYLALNRSATKLWPRVLSGTTRTELTESLRLEFPELEAAAAEQDVLAFLDGLRGHGLLEA